MMKRQRGEHIQMIGPNLQQLYCIPMHVLCYQVREREAQSESPQTNFDCHFPEAGDTEQPFVRAVLDELTCVGADGRIAVNKPEKGVRIE